VFFRASSRLRSRSQGTHSYPRWFGLWVFGFPHFGHKGIGGAVVVGISVADRSKLQRAKASPVFVLPPGC
jgi:hypothetical protein